MTLPCASLSRCPAIVASPCPDIEASACAACPADMRPALPCGTQTKAGGAGTTRTRHHLGSDSGTVSIDYDMYDIADSMDVYHAGVLVATTAGPVSGLGTLTWSYTASVGVPDWCLVIVKGPRGTKWVYTFNCPE